MLLIIGSSCRKDFDYAPSSGNLKFSKDTVYLDTIFTNIGSSTYGLKVYNKGSKDVEIPSITLENGISSFYRINVDGQEGNTFSNIPLLAKDSLYIYVETTFDIAPTNLNEFLLTDAILFDVGQNEQRVELVTLVKDAVFLYPSLLANGTKETVVFGLDENGEEIRVEGFELSTDQLHFTAEKPYVLYGYATVPENNNLIIDAGARVHFHKNSGLLIKQNATLTINGELSEDQELLEKEVIFQGDRLEPNYENVPNQWGGLWIAKGSTNNYIDHLTLKNAYVGLFVEGDGIFDTPTLTLKNSRIYNNERVNLWLQNARAEAQNNVIANAGDTSLRCSFGGNYTFSHCTIANYWIHGFRSGVALQMDNQKNDLVNAAFTNTIIDGNTNYELQLLDSGNIFDFAFKNCAIAFNDESNQFENNPLYEFDNTSYYSNTLFNINTIFLDAFYNDFRLTSTSETIDEADTDTALQIPLDILGNNRTTLPDIGAFEFINNN